MHDEATHFLKYVASVSKPHFTRGKLALDVGSYDYNGSNKPLFDSSCKVHGNDVFPGHNVDLVYKTAELPFFEPTFDTIVSSNCFQNDPEFKESLRKLVQILRPGGILAFTCATTGKPEHGTKKHKPEASLGARAGLSKWRDYYKPLTFEDIQNSIDVNAVFQTYAVFCNTVSKDLLFVGFKRNPKLAECSLDFSTYTNSAGNGIQTLSLFPLPELEPTPDTTILAENQPTQESSVHTVLSYDQLTDAEKAIVQKYLESM
jgi:SAM-dependent methyltransferase